MLDQFISWLQEMPPAGVLAFMFFIAYIENIFPPSPSDMLLVFAGTLIGVGTIGFAPSLFFATLGSTLGFMTAYAFGRYFDQHVVEGRLGRFLPLGAINQVERMFKRFGYGVIIGNRFFSGTRGIISFFAGMTRMNLAVTTALCAVGAAAWNAILLYLGMSFAGNWRRAAEYIQTYSKIATIIIVALVIIGLAIYFYRRRRSAAATTEPDH